MKYPQLLAVILLTFTWSLLRDMGTNVTSGPQVAGPAAVITQPLTLQPNHDYVVEFEAASSRETHIVAGFASGLNFAPGASFSLDLNRRGDPISVRHILNSGAGPKNLQLAIASSGAKILVRRISVRKRSIFWTPVAWIAMAMACLIGLPVALNGILSIRLPGTVSWAWPLVLAISLACILRNLALPRPFAFGDELLYAILSRFGGREAFLKGNPLTPVLPNSLYLHLYQLVFRFDDNFLEAAKVLNVLFFAVGLLALYATVRLFRPRNTALVVMGMAGLGPANIFSVCFMPESMYFCCFSWLIYCFVRYSYTQPFLGATLSGMCLAAAILVKPHGLVLIAPWLIALVLLKLCRPRDLSWRETGGMALCFILSTALVVALVNFALTGDAAFSLGAGYGPLVAASAFAGTFGRIARVMGAHLAALSSLYALPLLVAGFYLFQRPLESGGKAFRLHGLVLLTITCLVTLIFTTSKFTTMWVPGEPETQRLFERYYNFVIPWLVASFFCAWPELDWSKRYRRTLFAVAGAALGAIALLAILKLGPTHLMTFIDFPDIFWFYTQKTGSRFFVAVVTAAILMAYLLRKPSAALYGVSLSLLWAIASIWTTQYLIEQRPAPGDVAAAAFRPLISPEAFDRGLMIVAGGSDIDAYRLMFHLLGVYDVAVRDPAAPISESAVEDRPWIILAGSWPVKFSYQESASIGRYTLYLRPDGASRQYAQTQGVDPGHEGNALVEEFVKDPRPFARIDVLGQSVTSAVPVVMANAPLRISGWAVDPKQNRLAGAVVVVIDEKTYPAIYGEERTDVASFFRNPDLVSCGYSVDIPRDAVGKGPHEVSVRVVSYNRKIYWVGALITFNANEPSQSK